MQARRTIRPQLYQLQQTSLTTAVALIMQASCSSTRTFCLSTERTGVSCTRRPPTTKAWQRCHQGSATTDPPYSLSRTLKATFLAPTLPQVGLTLRAGGLAMASVSSSQSNQRWQSSTQPARTRTSKCLQKSTLQWVVVKVTLDWSLMLI